jgi:CheY-like chemotaxis protein
MNAVARRILVVEDNPDCRESLRMVLELYGYRVEVAADGRRGVEKALAWGPDAAVVDIGLPELDGYGVARRVRAALGVRIRLIALTGYAQFADRQRAFEAGFDAHLTKPADLDKLSRLLPPA